MSIRGAGNPARTPPAERAPRGTPRTGTRRNRSCRVDSRRVDSRPAGNRLTGNHPGDNRLTGSHPADSHPADNRLTDSHPADSRPADSHPADSHPADSHPADSHPADSHPGDNRLTDCHPDTAPPRHPARGSHLSTPFSDPAVESRLSADPVTDRPLDGPLPEPDRRPWPRRRDQSPGPALGSDRAWSAGHRGRSRWPPPARHRRTASRRATNRVRRHHLSPLRRPRPARPGPRRHPLPRHRRPRLAPARVDSRPEPVQPPAACSPLGRWRRRAYSDQPRRTPSAACQGHARRVGRMGACGAPGLGNCVRGFGRTAGDATLLAGRQRSPGLFARSASSSGPGPAA